MVKLTSRNSRTLLSLAGTACLAACSVSCDHFRTRPKADQASCESHLLYKWAPIPGSTYLQGYCTQKDLTDYFDDPDPALQKSVEAIKAITETDEFELAWERLRALKEIDLTEFPQITDLRPFSNLIHLRTLTLPPGANIITLAPLFSGDWSTEEYEKLSGLYDDEFEIVADDSVRIQSCNNGGGMIYGEWVPYYEPGKRGFSSVPWPIRAVLEFCRERNIPIEGKD